MRGTNKPPRGPRLGRLIAVLVVVLIAMGMGAWWGPAMRSAFGGVLVKLGGGRGPEDQEARAEYYTCGMHPWVILPEPGLCPVCRMELTPLDPDKFTGEVVIDPVVTQDIGVRIEPVVQRPLVRSIRTVGTVDYDETRVRDVNIKVESGWIEELYVDFLGAEVSRGDPLFDLYSPELYAAQDEFLIALRESRRLGGAGEGALDADQLLEAARTKLRFLDVTPQQIEALAESGTPAKTMTIYSPWEGVVIAKHANEGMLVNSGMQVFRIADLSRVWVMVSLYEYQLPFVQVGQRAVMTLPYIPGQTFEGEVLYLYPYLDSTTRQVNVRLAFDNADGLLKPGMYASIKLQSTLARQRTQAPRSAIIDTGERQVAFVSLGEGRFEPRQVRIGVETDDGYVEILDGLKPGEMVVTSGQFLLDSEARVREALAKMIRGDLAAEQEAVVATSGRSELEALPPEAAGALQGLLEAYFQIASTLAADSTEGVQPAARRIAGQVDALLGIQIPDRPHFWHEHDEAATIRGRALELVEAVDMEAARLKFADLSVALSALLAATGVPPEYGAEVHELHCPMYREGQGGSIWLQPAGPVRNPFFGSVMLECFDERRALPVTGREEAAEPSAPDAAPADVMDAEAGAGRVELDAAAQASADRLYGAYLAVHGMLTRDEVQGVPSRLDEIHRVASVLSDTPHQAIAAAAGRIVEAASGGAEDLEAARQRFEAVSGALIELAAVAPPGESVAPALYEVYCPMVKKSWLQAGEQVANPYAPYMLRCGQVKRTFAGN